MDAALVEKTTKLLDEMTLEEWQLFMSYFAPRMLEDQLVLIELLCRRAEISAAKTNEYHSTEQKQQPHQVLPSLLKICGLEVVLTS